MDDDDNAKGDILIHLKKFIQTFFKKKTKLN